MSVRKRDGDDGGRGEETGRREVRGAGGEAQVRAMKEGGKEGGRTSLGARQSHCGRDACV